MTARHITSRYHAVLALLLGCRDVATLSRADTLAPGHQQWLAAVELSSAPLFPPNPGDGAGFGPRFEVGYRRGITDRVELGAKLFPLGADVEGKVQLVRGERLDLAILAAAGYNLYLPRPGSNAAFHTLPVQISLLAGVHLGDHELVIAPKIVNEVWLGAGAGSHGSSGELVWGGGSLGFVWQLGRIAIVPELTVLRRVISDNNVGPGLGGDYTILFAAGVLLGR